MTTRFPFALVATASHLSDRLDGRSGRVRRFGTTAYLPVYCRAFGLPRSTTWSPRSRIPSYTGCFACGPGRGEPGGRPGIRTRGQPRLEFRPVAARAAPLAGAAASVHGQ